MYYLRVLYPMCSFVQSGVQHILHVCFFFFSSSFLPYVASSSGLSNFDWPFGIF